MDKKDFYRELMSQYTFDKEKIRRNAKRKPSSAFFERGSKWLPLSTAAAVFVTVFGGYMLFSPVFNPAPDITHDDSRLSPASFTDEEDDKLTASQRLEKMESLVALYNSDKLGGEIKTMYVTFAKPMTYPEFKLIIDTKVSDTGNVRVKSVFNGEFINCEGYESDNNTLFTGAKVQAPAYLYVKLSEVFEFVDCNELMTDENFEPLKTERAEETAPPVQHTEPVTSQSIAESIIVTAETTDVSTTPEVTEAAPSAEEITTETTPEDDTLPPLVVSAVIRIPAENVVDIEFISDEYFVMLFRNKAVLFRIINNGDVAEYEQVSSYDTLDPEITYVCPKNKTFVILGSDENNRRTELFIADGISNTLTKADVTAVTQDSGITYAFCNGERILLKASSLENSFLYSASKDEASNFRFSMLNNAAQTVVVSFGEESFIYASKRYNDNNEEITELFEYFFSDYEAHMLESVGELKGSVSFIRSGDLSSFAINNNDTGEARVWNSKSGELSVKLNAGVMKFSDYNSSIFTDGTNWYRLNGFDIEAVSETEAYSLSVKPDFSSKYTVSEVTSDMVKIEVK